MLHRGITFVHAAVLAYSAVLGFLFLRSLDEEWVLGQSAVVWVTDSDDAAGGSRVARVTEEFAETNRATIAREVPDLKAPHSRRHLYLTPHGPRAGWLKDGYPAFDRGHRTDVHPMAELGQRDPRGFYYVFGPDGAATSLAHTFSELGLRASVHHPHSVSGLGATYLGSALFRSFLVVALAAVTTTGAGVLLNAKAYGVMRLQGMSFGRILLRDVRQLARFWSAAFAAVTTSALILLGLYNGLAWIGPFAVLGLGSALALSLVALATHAAVLWLTFQTDLLRALKGEVPARAASWCAYLVRVPALFLALAIAGAVVLAGQDVLNRQGSHDAYAKVGDTTSIALNGSLASEDALRALDTRVGRWLRRADADGQVVVAGHRDLRRSAPRAGLPEGEILIVNESFLDEQHVLDASGRHHRPAAASPDEVRLLVPTGLDRYADRLREMVPGLLNPSDPDVVDAAQVRTLNSKEGQRVFTYHPRGQSHADENPGADNSFVTDPVIIAFPNGSPFLSDKGYTAYASQESVLFHDPDDVTAGIEKHHLETQVTGMSPVGENAALELRDLVRDFRLQLFNLGVAVAVLLITGVGVCIVHSRKNAQVIFVRHISGWTFTATHRVVLTLEGLLAALLAGWVPVRVWQQNQSLEKYRDLGIPPPRAPVGITGLDVGVTGGLVAVEIAAVLLALVVFHRRIVKEGATES